MQYRQGPCGCARLQFRAPPPRSAQGQSGYPGRFRLYRCRSKPCRRGGHAATAKVSGFSRGLRAASLEKNRSEEHTSELQSRRDLVCRLLLEKKKKKKKYDK